MCLVILTFTLQHTNEKLLGRICWHLLWKYRGMVQTFQTASCIQHTTPGIKHETCRAYVRGYYGSKRHKNLQSPATVWEKKKFLQLLQIKILFHIVQAPGSCKTVFARYLKPFLKGIRVKEHGIVMADTHCYIDIGWNYLYLPEIEKVDGNILLWEYKTYLSAHSPENDYEKALLY